MANFERANDAREYIVGSRAQCGLELTVKHRECVVEPVLSAMVRPRSPMQSNRYRTRQAGPHTDPTALCVSRSAH